MFAFKQEAVVVKRKEKPRKSAFFVKKIKLTLQIRRKQRKKEKNVGENNGQLRFVRHHGWRTQASLDQNVK